MIRRLCIALVATISILVSGVTGYLFLTKANPVVVRIAPDHTMRPRYYCFLNPFRDKGPETIATSYLVQLRAGQVQSMSCCIREREHILEVEKKYPIQSWRVANRIDAPGRSDLTYWVKRENGYAFDGYEEVVHFTVIRSGDSWKLDSFSAIY